MSKIIIVPDVHGRTFWKLAKEKINEVDRTVFLGDYLDPYPFERISSREAIEELKEIIDLKKKFPEKVILLIGNHDLNYMDLSENIFPCSRYDDRNAPEIKKYLKKIKNYFNYYIKKIDIYFLMQVL